MFRVVSLEKKVKRVKIIIPLNFKRIKIIIPSRDIERDKSYQFIVNTKIYSLSTRDFVKIHDVTGFKRS